MIQAGKGTKNMIAPKGSIKKFIMDNIRLDTFTFQHIKKTCQCN